MILQEENRNGTKGQSLRSPSRELSAVFGDCSTFALLLVWSSIRDSNQCIICFFVVPTLLIRFCFKPVDADKVRKHASPGHY